MVWRPQECVVIWVIDLSLASQLRASCPVGSRARILTMQQPPTMFSTWPGERSSTHATNMRGRGAVFAPGLQAVRTRSCGLETDLSGVYTCTRFLGLASRSSACSFLPSLALGRAVLLHHRPAEAPFLAALDPLRRNPILSLALCQEPVDPGRYFPSAHDKLPARRLRSCPGIRVLRVKSVRFCSRPAR